MLDNYKINKFMSAVHTCVFIIIRKKVSLRLEIKLAIHENVTEISSAMSETHTKCMILEVSI